jgi:hypothetical protein
MAVGDLVIANYTYEFNGLQFGHGTDIIVSKADGLLGKGDIKTTDVDRQDAWGTFPGRDMYKERRIVFSLDVVNDIQPNIEQTMSNIQAAWSVPDQSPPAPAMQLVFLRNWPIAGKRYYWVRPGRMAVPSDSDYAFGHAVVMAELKANDPRSYSLVEYSDTYTIANAATSVSGITINQGDSASAPILDIVGPAINPSVQNLTDNGKTFKCNVSLLAGDTLEVDFRQRTLTKNGVTVYDALDSNWWKLRPGANQITYNRQSAAAPSTMTLRHRDTWS